MSPETVVKSNLSSFLCLDINPEITSLIEPGTLESIRAEIPELLEARGLKLVSTVNEGWMLSLASASEQEHTVLGFISSIEIVLDQLRAWQNLLPEQVKGGFYFGAWLARNEDVASVAEWIVSGKRSAKEQSVLISSSVVRDFLKELPEKWESQGTEELSLGPGVKKNPELYRILLKPLSTDGSDACDAYQLFMKGTNAEEGVGEEAGQETRIGRFTLVSILGVGGMGQVWKARDQFGNMVALKMMLPGNATTQSQIQRFQREARVMSKLANRNICRIMEVGEADGVSFIAMELIDGISLYELLTMPIDDDPKRRRSSSDVTELIRNIRKVQEASSENGEKSGDDTAEKPKKKKIFRVLPVQQTLSIVTQVCSAIQFAHEHGIMHRDLKPANIMLREDGEPVVMDFGLAKLDVEEKETSLTMSGMMVGTVQFMAPEQALSSRDVDERADVYSLGAILYQMLTGKPHFATSGNLLKDAQNLQEHVPERLRNHNRSLDSDLEIVVLKALHVDVAQRYRNMQALRDDLERYRHGEVIQAKPVTFFDIMGKIVKRNKALTAVSLLSFLLLTVLGGAFVLRLRDEREAALAAEQLAQEKQKEAEETSQKLKETLELVQQREKEAREASQLAEKQSKELKELFESLNLEKDKRASYEKLVAESRAQVIEKKQEAEKSEAALKAAEEERERLKKIAEDANKKLQENAANPKKNSSKDNTAALNAIKSQLNDALGEVLGAGPYALRASINNALKTTYTLADMPTQVGEVYLAMGKLHLATMDLQYAVEALRRAVTMKGVSSGVRKEAKALLTAISENSVVREDFFDETKGTATFSRADMVREWKSLSSSPLDNVLSDVAQGTKFGTLSAADKLALIRLKKDITEGKL